MPTFAAFLRAINVGGHTVRMDALRRAFESLRFSSVETFIASGNVVFDTSITDTARLTATIERKLRGEQAATWPPPDDRAAVIADYKPFPVHLGPKVRPTDLKVRPTRLTAIVRRRASTWCSLRRHRMLRSSESFRR